MSLRMGDAQLQRLGDLRHEPTERWIRATLGERTVVDSTRAMLVWEPRRVVPSFAVPVDDLRAELVPAPPADDRADDHPVLHPGIPFAVHSTDGESFTLRVADVVRDGAAFRPSDRDLAGYVILDFDAFDRWYEEDDQLVGHPRDPYHRVDIRPSSRHVRIELDGRLLAESNRPVLVFETGLPTRFYLPREDIRADLQPSAKITHCAYKGRANYWSVEGGKNIAWTYAEPLRDTAPLAGLVAFWDELVDVTVGGEQRKRPDSLFAKALAEEFALSSYTPARTTGVGPK